MSSEKPESVPKDDRTDFRYGKEHTGPYEVIFERTDPDQSSDKNQFGFNRRMHIKFREHLNMGYGLRKVGFNRFRLKFNNYEVANELIGLFNGAKDFQEGAEWIAFIPNFKLFKDFVVHGIFEKDVTAKELVDWLRPPPGDVNPFPEIVKAERIKRVARRFEDGKAKVIFETNESGRKVPKLEDSNLFKIRCKTIHVPNRAVFWGLIVNVSPFVDRPRRCNHCHRFGHIGRYCRDKYKPMTCGRCSLPGHDARTCEREERSCINCQREKMEVTNHSAFDKNCPILILNQKIKEVMAFHNVDTEEAKALLKKHHGRNPPVQKKTFAETVKQKNDLATLVEVAKRQDDEKRKKAFEMRRQKDNERKLAKEKKKSEKENKTQIQNEPQKEKVQTPVISEERRAELEGKAEEFLFLQKLRNSSQQNSVVAMEVDAEEIKRRSQREESEEREGIPEKKGRLSDQSLDDMIPETQESFGDFISQSQYQS